MALTVESLLVTIAALVIAVIVVMLVARMMLGKVQATTRITNGRYLATAVVALVLIFVVSLIPWPQGFGAMGPVITLVVLIYAFKMVLLPDTAAAEQWPRSLWMAVITYVVFVTVNVVFRALFGLEAFTL